jgi:hypothetical protein
MHMSIVMCRKHTNASRGGEGRGVLWSAAVPHGHAYACHTPRSQRKESAVSPSQPSLPTNRAFVVQFRPQPTGVSSAYDGRVEHLVSGQVARFHSLEELLAFMVGVLTDVDEDSGSS